MTTPQLSNKTEGRIVSALQRIVDLVDEGSSPNDAIVKVAQEDKIPGDHLNLIVYAYNTGKQTSQRKSSDERTDKAANFPLAVLNDIVEKLYPKGFKSASQIVQETAVSEDYSKPPAWTAHRKADERRQELFAFAESKRTKAAAVTEPKDNPHVFSDLEKLRRQCEESYMKVASLHKKVDKKVEELDRYFNTAGGQRFADVFENAVIMYGEKAAALKDTLTDRRPKLKKEAASSTYGTVAKGKAYDLISDCLALSDEFFSAREELNKTLEKAASDREALLKPLQKYLPQNEHIGGSVLDNRKDNFDTRGLFNLPFVKRSFLPLGQAANFAAANAVIKGIGSKMPGGSEGKPLPSLISPTQASELRNVQMESMLSDLISNDPVIQGHGRPDEVLDIYNELSNMAPRAMGHKAVARAFLRKYLSQGNMADFDLMSLNNLEKGIANIGEPGSLMPSSTIQTATGRSRDAAHE